MGTAFGRGLIVGAGAALVYAAAREAMAAPRPRTLATGPDSPSAEAESTRGALIDWDWATRMAIKTAGRTPAFHPGARAELQSRYEQLLRDIEEPIARYTGNTLSLNNTQVEVLDRPGWIRANMANFRSLLQPVEDFYAESLNTSRSRMATPLAVQYAGRLAMGSQMGVLVGYLSRRVLGQYDIALLGDQPDSAGKLYFVEPNLQMVEHTLGVPPDELRRWIALHEATHAHEFELYPWVRDYLHTSMRQYLKLLIDDMRGRGGRGGDSPALAILNRFVTNLRQGHNVINALMSAQQRELMSRLQALMALAEGYSNHVMNAVGKELLPNFELIHERVESRQRQRTQAELLFLKITGLSLKMEQYQLGERFVDEVVRQRGIAFVNRAWQSPETLPTEAEIRNPEAWMGRMEAQQAA